MTRDEWRQVGIAMLSKSGLALNVCIGNDWYAIKVSELRRVMNGWIRFAKVSAHRRDEPWEQGSWSEGNTTQHGYANGSREEVDHR